MVVNDFGAGEGRLIHRKGGKFNNPEGLIRTILRAHFALSIQNCCCFIQLEVINRLTGSWQVMKGTFISIFKGIFPRLDTSLARVPRLRRAADFRAIALLVMAMLSLLMMAGATGCAAKVNPRESLAAQGRAPEGSPKLQAIYQP